MKPFSFAILLIALTLFGPSEALACRIRPSPTALRDVRADAIVLAQITAVEGAGASWSATASSRGTLMGAVSERAFRFANQPYDSCRNMSRPRPGTYWVLYLQRSDGGLRVHEAYPFWWARQSGDRRLAGLNRLMPLGAAREATPDENRLLDLVEARIQIPAAQKSLSRYVRVYARSSASIVTGMLMRSRTPRRLMVDESEELPTEESCRCTLVHVSVDLDDLWSAGQLPPFNR